MVIRVYPAATPIHTPSSPGAQGTSSVTIPLSKSGVLDL